MLTSHPINPSRAIEGMARSGYKSRPMNLPLVAQVTESVFTTSVVGNLVITVTDRDVNYSRSLTVALSTTTLTTSLDEIVDAWRADPFFAALGTINEDGTDTVEYSFRVKGKDYAVTYTLPGAMAAPTTTNTTAPIDERGQGIEFGRFVKRGSGAREIETLASGDAVGDLVGLIRRTEGNHFHKLVESVTDVDATLRGKDYPVLWQGYIWVRAEAALTPDSTPFVRIAGNGEIGGLAATADGGNAIDASSICRIEEATTTDDEGNLLALLWVNIAV